MDGVIRPIHYLGSKLRMLDAIKKAIDIADTSEGRVCDLFSGSGTVSGYMLQFRDVISVDIQEYSKVLCRANLNGLKNSPRVEIILEDIKKFVCRSKIIDSFEPLIHYEKKNITEAKKGNIDALYEIVENGSLLIYETAENANLSHEFEKVLLAMMDRLHENNLYQALDIMITRYFGGLYFSYEQAAIMDCIESFVFEQDGLIKTKLLAALLSTASDIVNTVGKQFAQPLKVRDARGSLKKSLLKKILKDRSLNVMDHFSKWVRYYFEVPCRRYRHDFLCADYVEALDKLSSENISVIYADPPYTRYHYSRYYHVLETICLRDNPAVSTTFSNGTGGVSRAIYRMDRHQSPFCIKTKAEQAFDLLLKKASALAVPLVLSYSPFDSSSKAVTPRLQTIDQLMIKAQTYYNDVSIISPGRFTHSKLNSVNNNFSANHEAEMLFVCKQPKEG